MIEKHTRIILVCFALTSITFAQTQFKYVSINFPGAFSTQVNGINNGGEIVGTYMKTSCTGTCVTHGFKFVNSKFTTVDIPGASSTTVEGVNDFGDLVGSFINSSNTTISHGFLLHHTGRLETLDLTGQDQSNTTPLGINKNLTVVGSFIDDSSQGVGFIWQNGKFTRFDLGGGAIQQSINDISNLGVMIGFFFKNGQSHAFIKSGSDLDVLPDFRTESSTAQAGGVNGRGDIVGMAFGHGGFFAAQVEKGEGATDKPETAPHYVELRFPGAIQTAPSGINFNRAIVGTYQGSDRVNHGFLAIPR